MHIPKYEIGDIIIRKYHNEIGAYKIAKVVQQTLETTSSKEKLLYYQYKMNLLYSISGGVDYDVYNDTSYISSESVDTDSMTIAVIKKEEKVTKLPKINSLYNLIGYKSSVVLVTESNEEATTYRPLIHSENIRKKSSILFFHFYEEYDENQSKQDLSNG